jgi:membrane protein DedA with SNARE-associated domain
MSIPAIHHGSAIAPIAAIVLGAFISEDGATISAATLAASNALDFRLAFLGAFIGLWGGDLRIYALTRGIGPIMQHRWFAEWFTQEKAHKSNPRGNNGQLSLAMSRFFPGTRLPAYVSAGLGRMPVLIQHFSRTHREMGILASVALLLASGGDLLVVGASLQRIFATNDCQPESKKWRHRRRIQERHSSMRLDGVFPTSNGVSSGRLSACVPSLLFLRTTGISLV